MTAYALSAFPASKISNATKRSYKRGRVLSLSLSLVQSQTFRKFEKNYDWNFSLLSSSFYFLKLKYKWYEIDERVKSAFENVSVLLMHV